jgi:tetratricopeptide (TPR) repeat protein
VAGSVVATKGGEELRFVREQGWRGVELRQDLIGGDALRTNSIGNLAILFADQTQIRVGRNSTLVVNEVATSQGNTQLELQAGQVWARAARGGSGVDVKTPAAVAAIRGTDWSLSVDGSGKTSLVVLEGIVELRNAQGSVTVRQGEGAVSAIGQAPTKFVLVSPNDHEQMLFYVTLRDAFMGLPVTTEKGSGLQVERARIIAIPPAGRTADDWLSLAEVAFRLDGRQAAVEALAAARRMRLTRGQSARADLLEGMLAGTDRRWREAAALFARAERGLDSKRRVTAVYGRYIAASLADPKRVLPEPKIAVGSPEAALAHAFIAGFKEDLNKAAELAAAAEKRFPADPRLAVLSGQLSLALDRRDQMRASIERVRALDPNDHLLMAMDGQIKASIDRNRKAGLADLQRAAAIAPGDSSIWNAIGLVQSELDAPLEAEAALRRAIETDPQDPVPYGNLAIHLLDQSRVEEAGALIDKALELDPDFHVAYIARGRYLLQKGDTAGAIVSILAGSAANPAYSQGLVAAAIAYYHNGEIELADQAFDNADRLDPNEPVIAIMRTAVAIDQYRADDAVRYAREAVRRARARGGDYAGIAVNRESGSYPVEAYRFINLNEWARYYGDRTFDPFSSSSYFDQAATDRATIVTAKPTISTVESGTEYGMPAYSLLIQGLLFDPLAVAGRIGRIDFVRRPFLDVEVGGGIVSENGRAGWQTEATVQGFSNQAIPTSFSLTAGRTRSDGRYDFDQERADTANLLIGAAPSAADRFLLMGTVSTSEPGPFNASLPTQSTSNAHETTNLQLGAGWSHSFGYRNVLNAAVLATRGDVDEQNRQAGLIPERQTFVEVFERQKTRVDATLVGVNHMIGFGDVTLRYGAEAIVGETKTRVSRLANAAVGGQVGSADAFESTDGTFRGSRLFADAFWRPTDWFEAQAGLERTALNVDPGDAETRVGPRAGVGVSPFEGQWLRAAYRSDAFLPTPLTLSSVTTVGLIPNPLPVTLGGRADTLALRWDAEWSPHFFTAVEYQRQDIRSLDLPIAETYETIGIDKAQVERVAATANLWLGNGIGVFGTVGAASSEIKSGPGYGLPVPYVAERFARAGITFVHPSRLKLTIAQTFFGDLTGNLARQPLKDYWTTDAALTWETPDRRLLIGLTALNLFDEEYELAPTIPGPGRTVAATLKARF